MKHWLKQLLLSKAPDKDKQMYKLIDIINNTSLDDLILDTWNLDHIGIEASAIIRHKGYFDIHTSYQFEYSWTGRITFAQALKLLNHKG